MRRAVLWVLPLLLGAMPAAAAPAGLAGYYRIPQAGPSSTLILAVAACGTDRYCGRLVNLGSLPAKDARNPSPAAQDRALCGLEILSVADDGSTARLPHMLRGNFYDPRTGDNTTVGLWLDADGKAHVSGFAGQPILSRSYVRPEQIWQRVPEPQLACDGARPVS
jgi:hypothetical protein